MTDKTREGLLYGIGAYGLWGIVPFYFAPLMKLVRAEEFIAHRVVWSLVFLAPILAMTGRWRDVQACWRRRQTVLMLLLSALFIAGIWAVYILCVAQGIIVHASLGYFLTPLVNVVLGTIFFGERLRVAQGLAVVVATSGVATLILMAGEFPWLGLSLALSFGFYGLVRKQVPVDGLVGLSVETMVLAPIALGLLIYWKVTDTLAFGTESRGLDLLIACSGVVTAVPLLCFGQATRRLSLTTLGFFQYLSPSLQFVLAVTVFDEPFTWQRGVSFALIWAAVALFVVDSWQAYRREHRETAPVTET